MPSQLPAQTCRQRFVPHWSHWVCSVNRFLSQGKKQNARIVLRRQSLDCLWVYGGFTPILHFQICMVTCPCLLESEYENAEKQATKAATTSIFLHGNSAAQAYINMFVDGAPIPSNSNHLRWLCQLRNQVNKHIFEHAKFTTFSTSCWKTLTNHSKWH